MRFPNLLYVADVAVESTVGGELLMYRLLNKYPEDRLTIAESNLCQSDPSDRLNGVEYTTFDVGYPRLLKTRLAQWYGSWLHLKARRIPAALEHQLHEAQPGALLTVWHGYSWITAAALARKYDLPLHLILHDDVPFFDARAHPAFRSMYHRDFDRVYKQAASRLCVSPYMEEAYRERYGVPGQVMYPMRSWETPKYDEPPPKLKRKESGIVIGYAGSLHTPGFKGALHKVASVLQPRGGRLLIYSDCSPETARQKEWTLPNMDLHSFIPPSEVIDTLREEADVLFLPMAFEGNAAFANRTNFPSKLTDYTATGLPLLVQGPEDSSAVRWARENEGTAEVITSKDIEALRPAVQRLIDNPAHRYKLGRESLRVGENYFSPQTGWGTFKQSIC
jgi:glycosyltransferase involved in cell wall biosynthesis